MIKDRFNSDLEIAKRPLSIYRELTGLTMAKLIADDKPDLVIDLGCGSNPFKKYIPNLIGIDKVNRPEVDIVDDLYNATNHFRENSADYILNFGPLQYYEPEPQVELMVKLLKPTGRIICHTALDAPWTIEYVEKLGQKFNLEVASIDIGYTDTTKMTKEELKIQKEYADFRGYEMKDRMVPRLCWVYHQKN